MALSKVCTCGRDLVWDRPSLSWVCPEVPDQLVGLIKPLQSAFVIREQMTRASAGPPGRYTKAARDHITCLPAELFDDTIDVGHAAKIARGEGLPRPVDEKGKRAVKGAGTGGEALRMFNCDGKDGQPCGYRTGSPRFMEQHIDREGHDGAENAYGERIERAGTHR